KRGVVDKLLSTYDMGYLTDYPPRDEIHNLVFFAQRDPGCELEKAVTALKKAALECPYVEPLMKAAREYKAAVEKGKGALGRYLTEDYAFYRLWRMTGGTIQLYLDASIQHWGVHCFKAKARHYFKKADQA